MALRGSLLKLVTGDANPALTITLRDRNTKNPVDLTGVVSGVMHFRKLGATTVLGSYALTLVTPLTKGQVILTWPAGSLNVDPGRYEGEIQLTGSGSKQQTVYETLQFLLRKQFA